MSRFDRRILPSMTVREVRALYPESADVFERLGFRSVCDDCSIETVARRQGLSPREVVDAVDLAILSDEASRP